MVTLRSRSARLPMVVSHNKEKSMPYVNVQITKGASKTQKAKVIKDITDSLVTVLGKKPEHIHVVIQEIADEDWGFEGMPTDEWKEKNKRSDQ